MAPFIKLLNDPNVEGIFKYVLIYYLFEFVMDVHHEPEKALFCDIFDFFRKICYFLTFFRFVFIKMILLIIQFLESYLKITIENHRNSIFRLLMR